MGPKTLVYQHFILHMFGVQINQFLSNSSLSRDVLILWETFSPECRFFSFFIGLLKTENLDRAGRCDNFTLKVILLTKYITYEVPTIIAKTF